MNNDVFTEEMYAEDEFDGGNLSPLETQQNNDGGGANPGNEPNDHEPSNNEDLTTEVLRLKAFCDTAEIFCPHSLLLQAALPVIFHQHESPYWKSPKHCSDSQTRTEYLRLTASHHNQVHVHHEVFHLPVYLRSALRIRSHILW